MALLGFFPTTLCRSELEPMVELRQTGTFEGRSTELQRSGKRIHLLSRSKSGNQIHRPLSLHKMEHLYINQDHLDPDFCLLKPS